MADMMTQDAQAGAADWLHGSLTDGLFAVYFLCLIAALVFGRRSMSSPWLFLLRSFVPNWRFFHALAHTPRLFVRIKTDQDIWSDWVMMMPRRQRHWSHLVANADVNLALLQQTLVEHLSTAVNELSDQEKIEDTTVYPMVERLVRTSLLPAYPVALNFQFCVCLFPTGDKVDIDQDMILLSPELSR